MKKLNPWAWCPFDPYPLVRPFLFLLDPEDAHGLTMTLLSKGWGPKLAKPDDPVLKTSLFGLDFSNPIMLAAGLDKQATAIDGVFDFGFGSLEIGSVTPRPQPGNSRPRMFRAEGAKALINHFGFNSVGAEVFAARVKAWRAKPERRSGILGINIAKNNDTVDDAVDYVYGIEKLADLADFVVVNISCPNAPGMLDLQKRERLSALLAKIFEAQSKTAKRTPLLVKISPDLDETELDDIAAVVLESPVAGVVIGNTSQARPSTIPAELAAKAGGLSGPPIFGPSTRLLGKFYQRTGGKIPLIACGGVVSGQDAYDKIRAGASLVQVYTALIFEGPFVIERIKKELAALLKKDGFASPADAVGAAFK